VVREGDSTIVIMSGEDSFKMRSVYPTMLNGKNWVIWKFQFEQAMRANHILDILDGSFKKPIKPNRTRMVER